MYMRVPARTLLVYTLHCVMLVMDGLRINITREHTYAIFALFENFVYS